MWSGRIYDRSNNGIWYRKVNNIRGYSVESVYNLERGYYYFCAAYGDKSYCSLTDNIHFTREKECMAACERYCEENAYE